MGHYKRRDQIRLSLPVGLDFLAICIELGWARQAIIRLDKNCMSATLH